jgi:predicted DCC family thiol-disulfide oxidoreductase YuxK
MSLDRPIILFDSLCVLCSANARFLLEHDRRGIYRLASLQSELGAALCRRFGVDPDDPDTLLLVEGDRARRGSDAVIAIYAGLGGPWRAVALARLVPRRLRDPLYRWVVRHRFGLFGRRDACWRPIAEYRDRLL